MTDVFIMIGIPRKWAGLERPQVVAFAEQAYDHFKAKYPDAEIEVRVLGGKGRSFKMDSPRVPCVVGAIGVETEDVLAEINALFEASSF